MNENLTLAIERLETHHILSDEMDTTLVRHIKQLEADRDRWRNQCEKMAEALKDIKNLEGLGKADEDIPDDKEEAYRIGSTDTLLDTFRISSEAIASYEAIRKEKK